jgi:hypothetical protein
MGYTPPMILIKKQEAHVCRKNDWLVVVGIESVFGLTCPTGEMAVASRDQVM